MTTTTIHPPATNTVRGARRIRGARKFPVAVLIVGRNEGKSEDAASIGVASERTMTNLLSALTSAVVSLQASGLTLESAGLAALAVGLAGLGAGIAERGIGAAAVGAIAEDRDLFGPALILTVLPETIVILVLVTIFVV